VPDNEVLAPGESDQEHITEDARAMTNSQQTAQVVAERALGKHVPIEKLGAQLLASRRVLRPPRAASSRATS
jgi:PDZ domain-containing secreted protein